MGGCPQLTWQVVMGKVCEVYIPRTPTYEEGLNSFTFLSLVLSISYQFRPQFLFVSSEEVGL